jgi:peptidylprolyl isomerase
MNKITSIIILVIVASFGYLVITKGPKREAPVTNDQSVATDQTAQVNQDNYTQPMNQEMKMTTTKEGTGEGIKTGQTAVMNYTGRLEDGTVFDSNVDPKFNHVQPFEFTLGENHVIQGWEKGVLGMKVGEKRTLVIPSDLGYGDMGYPPVIPAKATLTFDVELVSIK